MLSRTRWVVAGVGAISAILGIVVFLVPYVREADEVRELAQRAREAVAANRDGEARRLLDEWSALKPRDGEPDYHRARLDIRAERPSEALDAIRRSISKGYPEPPLLVLRAILLARAGKFAEAEPVLASAFRSGEEPRIEVAEGLSRVYLKTFRLAETIQVLEAWMKAAPEDPRPFLRRNEVDERANAEPAVLIRNYREALRRDSTLDEARLGLAEKLREASLFDEAEVEFAALLERDPRNLRGLVGAGRIALLKGDLQAATRHYEAALAVDPKEKTALRELGLIDLNSGRIPRACARLKVAAEVDPFDPEVHYSYARALKTAGDLPKAAEEAATTERLKDEQKRIIDLRQNLVQHPGDTELRREAAQWLIDHGHEKEGLEWTDLILRQKPGDPKTCRLLVDYYTSRGNLGLANYYRLDAAPATSGK